MLITLFKTFLLPPALQILMLILALLLWRRWKIVSSVLLGSACLSLLLLSLPIVSAQLFVWLESPYRVAPELRERNVQTIIVLGGGRERHAPEYGGDQVNRMALQRLRYGAYLAKQLQVPIIVSGGRVYPYEQQSEAQLAKAVLQKEWGIADVWLEEQSRDTWQNAQLTAVLLKERDIQRVVLVTHAYHMRRAVLSFSRAGVEVIPMATGFFSSDIDGWWDDYLPRASALQGSAIALHEYMGLLFYRLR